MKNGNVLLTVGNGMMGDDGAGALLAQMLQEQPCEQWTVLHGGSAPENVLHLVRSLSPHQVLVVDACDMDLPAGARRVIPDEALQCPFFFSTHTLPLSYLVDALRQFTPQVTFLGIQPQEIAFGYPLSSAVRQAVAQIAQDLHSGCEFWRDYEVVVVN